MPPEQPHRIQVHLDRLLAERGMTLTELAERVGVTIVNLSVLKNGKAKAVRFSTLTAICRELDCQPGDLLSYRPEEQPRPAPVRDLRAEAAGRPVPAARGPGSAEAGSGRAASGSAARDRDPGVVAARAGRADRGPG
jgi:putative transcriptional regulator